MRQSDPCSSSIPQNRNMLEIDKFESFVDDYASKLDAIINSSPTSDDYRDIGNDHFRRGNWSNAIESYTDGLLLKVTPTLLLNRAIALAKLGRYREVIRDTTASLLLKENQKARHHRFIANQKLQNFKQCLIDFEYMALTPEDMQVVRDRAHDADLVPNDSIDRVINLKTWSKDDQAQFRLLGGFETLELLNPSTAISIITNSCFDCEINQREFQRHPEILDSWISHSPLQINDMLSVFLESYPPMFAKGKIGAWFRKCASIGKSYPWLIRGIDLGYFPDNDILGECVRHGTAEALECVFRYSVVNKQSNPLLIKNILDSIMENELLMDHRISALCNLCLLEKRISFISATYERLFQFRVESMLKLIGILLPRETGLIYLENAPFGYILEHLETAMPIVTAIMSKAELIDRFYELNGPALLVAAFKVESACTASIANCLGILLDHSNIF